MITQTPNRTVQPNERLGGWEIVRAGSRRAAAFEATKDGAVRKARSMVKRDGGGEVRIKDEIGKVVESTTIRGPLWRRRLRAHD